MLKLIPEAGKNVGITGFKDVKMEAPKKLLDAIRYGTRPEVAVQFFNADLVATWEHLYFAVVDALTAFTTRRSISKNLAVEVMLYASAQRQIRKAIELLGVKPGCPEVAVVVVAAAHEAVEAALKSISKHFDQKQDDKVLELSPAKVQNIRRVFALTDEELAVVTKDGDVDRALVDLVIERMALLATKL